MEIKVKKTSNGNVWKFVNETWSNSNGWGHKTTVFRFDYDFEPHKVRYYNRTWERYTYQTCMSGAVEEIYQEELKRFIDNYKYKNEIVRFKNGQLQEVQELFKNEIIAQDLLELKEAISDNSFDSINE